MRFANVVRPARYWYLLKHGDSTDSSSFLQQSYAKQIRSLINLRDTKSNHLSITLSQMERNKPSLPAVQFLIDGIARNLENVLVHGYLDDFVVFPFASSEARSVSGGVRARGTSVGAASDSHCVRIPAIESTAVPFTQRLRDVIAREQKVRVRWTLEPSEDFRRAAAMCPESHLEDRS